MPTLMLPAGGAAVSPPPLSSRSSIPPFPTSRFSSIASNRPHRFAVAWPVACWMRVDDPPVKKPAVRRRVSGDEKADFGSSEAEKAKLAQVGRRLVKTARYFKRLGSLGFWMQLVCTLVSAVLLSLSVVATGKVTSPAAFYATAAGIAAAFNSVFRCFGYIRLSERLKRTARDPSKAPPRADVVKSLKNGIAVNLLGMGAAILGFLATVGLLFGEALASSANPYHQPMSSGYRPVLALDVFLVQASANTILSHFVGLVFSLELLRSVTLPTKRMPQPPSMRRIDQKVLTNHSSKQQPGVV